MKVAYDSRTGTLSVVFRPGMAMAESDEARSGVVLDFDETGNLVSLEILDASRRVTEADRVEFQSV